VEQANRPGPRPTELAGEVYVGHGATLGP
jgi:hypothetical protein